MKHFFLPVLIIYLLIIPGQLQGQNQKQPQAQENLRQLSASQYNQVRNTYFQSVIDPSEIMNGREYLPYFYRSNTTPLIFNGVEFNSVLFMNGRKYENIKLQYDTFIDELIYRDTSIMINFQYPRITLNKNVVQGFSFLNGYDSLNFRYIKFPEKDRKEIDDGYYEVAFKGRSCLLIQHRSKQYRSQAVYAYEYSPAMYVSLGDGYKLIRNTKDFLPMFGKLSPEIKEYIKTSKIRIRQAGKLDIIRILKYYDSLSKPETRS